MWKNNFVEKKREGKHLEKTPGSLNIANKVLFWNIIWKTDELKALCKHNVMYVQNVSSKFYSDVCCYYIFNVYPISVQPMSLLSANIQSILLFYSSLSVDSFTFSVFFLNNKSTILKCSGLFSQGESERKGTQYADE